MILNQKPVGQAPDVRSERLLAVAATGLVATLLLLSTVNAGPLWRDEANTLNIAQSPSLADFWHNLPFESFPPLYMLVLRAWATIGMAATDAGIRVLGLFIGLLFLGALWVCRRWVGGGAPTISLALLGSLPSMLFGLTSNRAYGIALCLLVFSFATIWRLVELPSRSRILVAGAVCLLFVHSLYYSIVFLGAMLLGAALVALRRRQWRALVALVGIGGASAASLSIYLPVIKQGSAYVPMLQVPGFGFGFLWARLNGAIALQSSAQPPSVGGLEVWIWVPLILLAVVLGVWAQFHRPKEQPAGQEPLSPPPDPARARADLALFGITAMVVGTLGQVGFLMNLHFPTQSWYYVGLFTLCAICLEVVLGAPWAAWRPWGLARVTFLGVMVALGWRGVWEEAHTRRSNVDLIVAALGKEAAPGDLIVVYTAWEGIPFERYYPGGCSWRTVPPIASHKVHRTDLLLEMLGRTNAMAALLVEVTDTLHKGGAVWVVGHVGIGSSATPVSPPPPAPALPTKWWLGAYFSGWSDQLTAHLAATASKTQTLELPLAVPVNLLENLPVFRFSGYKPGPDR